ncbi:hypothetical protein [Thalassoglobus sp.]|uniref:hypothetical protein n=1 Tax=Thalassoglobus sp. TaxID=2795869 RepID=UPI003AA84611
MQKWVEIRRLVLNGEISERAACRRYEIHWETLGKILTFTEPPSHRRKKPHRKQRDMVHRIFERLRDEHGYDGGLTIVADACC